MRKSLENLCDEDLEVLQDVIDTFDLIALPPETQKWFTSLNRVTTSGDKRQISTPAAVGIISCLAIIFTKNNYIQCQLFP